MGSRSFELGAEIGDGAVGLVRKATELSTGTVVAVKFLAPDPKYIEEDVFDDVAARFKREGERGAKLEHPHVMSILEAHPNTDASAFDGSGPSNPFIVMEYLQGSTLDGYLRRVPEAERGIFQITKQRLLIAIQVASALAYLHKRKLVHRDVKPANIFLSSRNAFAPTVKVGDFGVMKWGDFHAAISTGVLTATSTHHGLGTLKYMSPEQAIRPKEVTVRSDMYSLGITLFELFTGQVLAGPHHVFEVMMARLARGTTSSRYFDMGYSLALEDEDVAALILDMHLRGVAGRPAIEKVLGTLSWFYERRFGSTWESAIR